MTNEQINAAIAEACGWTQLEVEDFSEMGIPCFMAIGVPPKFIHSEISVALPNYCNDISAMHEAEMWLRGTDDERLNSVEVNKRWALYMHGLGYWSGIVATARQRAEAFLRTIGKWEEAVVK